MQSSDEKWADQQQKVAVQNETCVHGSLGIPGSEGAFKIHFQLPLSLFTRWSWSGEFLRMECRWGWKLNSQFRCFSRGICKGFSLWDWERHERRRDNGKLLSTLPAPPQGENSGSMVVLRKAWELSSVWLNLSTPHFWFLTLHKIASKVLGLNELIAKFLQSWNGFWCTVSSPQLSSTNSSVPHSSPLQLHQESNIVSHRVWWIL